MADGGLGTSADSLARGLSKPCAPSVKLRGWTSFVVVKHF